MTKKDGDKIRTLQVELKRMQSEYAAGSTTEMAATELHIACELALRGQKFRVVA